MDRGLRQEYPPTGNFSARRIVPADVRGKAGLGSELFRSLETNDLTLARRRLADVMAEFDALIHAARNGKCARVPTIYDVEQNLRSWRFCEIASLLGPGVTIKMDITFATLGVDTTGTELEAMVRQAHNYFEEYPGECRTIAMPQPTAVLLHRLEKAVHQPDAWVEVPDFDRLMDEAVMAAGVLPEREIDLANVAPFGASLQGAERFVTLPESGVGRPLPPWLKAQARVEFASCWLEVARTKEWARSRAATLLAAEEAMRSGPSAVSFPTTSTGIVPRHDDRSLDEVITAFKTGALNGPAEVRRFAHVFETLTEIVGANFPIRAVVKSDIQATIDLLAQVPTNASKRWPNMSLIDAIAHADADDLERLAPKTVKVYASNMRALFKWTIDRGWADTNPCDGISVESSQRVKRRAFTNDEVKHLFATLKPYEASRPERWWIPALALYTGARQNELAQLEVSDVQVEDGVHFLDLSEFGADGVRTESKHLKTPASDRLVPLHPDVIDAGFLKHVAGRRNAYEIRVFDLPEGPAGGRAHAYSKDFGRHLRRIGIMDRGACFHSTRHLWRELAERAGLSDRQIDAIGGWKPVGQSAKYGRRTILEVIAPLVANISVGDFRLVDVAINE